MENMYIISENELLDLLTSYYTLDYLEAEGVDNWSWYMENRREYLGEFEDFEDKAKDDLKYYTNLKDVK